MNINRGPAGIAGPLIIAGGLYAAEYCTRLAAGLFDYYAGLSDGARQAVFSSLIVVGVAGAVWALWSAITFMRRDAAAMADKALGSGRRDVAGGLHPGAGPLRRRAKRVGGTGQSGAE